MFARAISQNALESDRARTYLPLPPVSLSHFGYRAHGTQVTAVGSSHLMIRPGRRSLIFPFPGSTLPFWMQHTN